MPNVSVYDAAGEIVGEINLCDAVFGIEPHVPSMHLAVRSYLANQRAGTQSTLTRGEVRGGGKKPWRQKGSGRARAGSSRGPNWTHGGVAQGNLAHNRARRVINVYIRHLRLLLSKRQAKLPLPPFRLSI